MELYEAEIQRVDRELEKHRLCKEEYQSRNGRIDPSITDPHFVGEPIQNIPNSLLLMKAKVTLMHARRQTQTHTHSIKKHTFNH